MRQKLFEIEVTILNADDELHHQFVEGEPFTVRVTLTATVPTRGATISVGLCDELGRDIGDRAIKGVVFAEGQRQTIKLQIDDPPLRSGLFQVDVMVTETDGGAVLFEAPAVESLSIYGRAPDSGGPVQIGGRWVVD